MVVPTKKIMLLITEKLSQLQQTLGAHINSIKKITTTAITHQQKRVPEH
jgi:hypothetical protein